MEEGPLDCSSRHEGRKVLSANHDTTASRTPLTGFLSWLQDHCPAGVPRWGWVAVQLGLFFLARKRSTGRDIAGGRASGGHMAQGICGLLERWAEPGAAGGCGAVAGRGLPGGEWRPGLVGPVQLVAIVLGILGVAGLSGNPGGAAALQRLVGGGDGARPGQWAGANGAGLAGSLVCGGSHYLVCGSWRQSRRSPFWIFWSRQLRCSLVGIDLAFDIDALTKTLLALEAARSCSGFSSATQSLSVVDSVPQWLGRDDIGVPLDTGTMVLGLVLTVASIGCNSVYSSYIVF